MWSPPPAAAVIAWLFVCPRLMYPYWQRRLFRVADLIIEIPAGSEGWAADIHEPPILTLFFPYVRSNPWQLKVSPKLLEMEISLRCVLKTNNGSVGSLLQKVCLFSEGLKGVPLELVFGVLQARRGFKLPGRKSRKQ